MNDLEINNPHIILLKLIAKAYVDLRKAFVNIVT